MIEKKQTVETTSSHNASLASAGSSLGLRGRRLSALEIAEGALLADIGVVFQILIKYLPVGGNFLQLLVPVIFAIVVLRRGLYVGCMSMSVALFLVFIILGPGGVPFLLLEIGAGLFLGMTMRHRLGHFLTFLLGVIGGGLGLWSVMLFYSLISGGPYLLVRLLKQSYAAFAPLVGALLARLGLESYWQQTLFPLLDHFMQWGFQYWLVLFYLVSCLVCAPVVIVVYGITNFFLRMLGYRVRPFPGYRLEGLLYVPARWLLKLLPHRFVRKSTLLSIFAREIRYLNMARLRQQRQEREEKRSL